MALVNIERPISFNSANNRYEKSILVKNSDGNIVRDTQVFETEGSPSISDSATKSALEYDNIVENITSQIEDSKITYTITNEYIETSLAVYYNGLNISKDISSKSSKSFVLISEYTDLIIKDESESLIVIYSKKI